MALEIFHPIFTEVNELNKKLAHEHFVAFAGEYLPYELEIIEQIALNTADLLEQECKERDKTGFMLGVSINNKATVVIQMGIVNEKRDGYGQDGAKIKFADFVDAKIGSLKVNSKFSRSSQRIDDKTTLLREDVVGGAVAFENGIKIGISGLSKVATDDENAVLKIGGEMGFVEATTSDNS